MKYLHTMIRVYNLEQALDFFCNKLELKIFKKNEYPKDKFTLIFLGTEQDGPVVELTYNWEQKDKYTVGRNFGHLAFEVENIYSTCQKLMDSGVQILRPPRDGRMAFIRSPDLVSIELLQKGEPLKTAEPWVSMPNQGEW